MVKETINLIDEISGKNAKNTGDICSRPSSDKTKNEEEVWAFVDWRFGYGLVLMSDRTYYLGIV